MRSFFPIMLTLLAAASPAAASETYYLLMFGSQRVPANPNYSHTFASFVRASWPDAPAGGPATPVLEAHTISWLPANGIVRVNALLPETGRNWEMHETVRWCQCNDMRISLWGAYCIEPELYGRAIRQIGLLQSGQVRYKADDIGRRSDRVSNCIHAVSSLSEGYRLRVLTPGWGETASYYVLQELEEWVPRPDVTHPWVGSALGLDHYPIIYRDYQNPRSGIGGGLYRVLGGERNLKATYGPPVR